MTELKTEVEVDLGGLHPDNLSDTKQAILADLDSIDQLAGHLQDIADRHDTLNGENAASVLSERMWDLSYSLHESLGRIEWLIHRQDVVRRNNVAGE